VHTNQTLAWEGIPAAWPLIAGVAPVYISTDGDDKWRKNDCITTAKSVASNHLREQLALLRIVAGEGIT
jgi:hypothetical protein